MMFFGKQTKNRRLKRDNVLEVKLRSEQVRKERLKLASGVIAVCLTLIIGGLAIWRGGEWCMDRLVYENDAFAIKTVDVKTDGVLSPDVIRAWSQIKTNANLLALDLKQVKDYLELAPMIQHVSVERVLPSSLRIRVTERVPVAQVYTLRRPVNSNRYEPFIYHLDANGFVMLPVGNNLRSEPTPAGEWFPTITGVPASELRPGKLLEVPQIQDALKLVVAFENSPMFGLVDLKQVDVSEPEVLKVSTLQGNEVVFRLKDFEGQFQRWRMAFDYAQRVGQRLGVLDLSVTNNVPMLYAQRSDAPIPAPKPKTTRTRKKNV
ncbi:MAG TPA: FtsQ-type POTRA domain-containing protein [Verrucomicrobiae bacterium]